MMCMNVFGAAHINFHHLNKLCICVSGVLSAMDDIGVKERNRHPSLVKVSERKVWLLFGCKWYSETHKWSFVSH